ncbi:MAG: hypothetical protein E6923_04590 [Clostridium sp.]|uniref:hypothetical protein n=1 Tax=Clostridium sp. TaxID=1506 RepID=UPI002900FF57|nr:hypothetical protein [Clostridium sp.]MDU1309985.1 hypothetical protein [Clostridium sp.]MDU1407141.1 hypothetical protein [Clostridium sp.]
MYDLKTDLEENIREIDVLLNNEEIQKCIYDSFNLGIKAYLKKESLNVGKQITTYPASKGIKRASEIGDAICNSKEAEKLGIKTDIILTSHIPIIRIGKIALTIKSLKTIDDIYKCNSQYIKDYSRINKALSPQTDMFLDNPQVELSLNSKYYGVLVYKIGQDNTISNMTFVFLNDKCDMIVHKVEVDLAKFRNSGEIGHEDPSTAHSITREEKSLKDKIKLKA